MEFQRQPASNVRHAAGNSDCPMDLQRQSANHVLAQGMLLMHRPLAFMFVVSAGLRIGLAVELPRNPQDEHAINLDNSVLAPNFTLSQAIPQFGPTSDDGNSDYDHSSGFMPSSSLLKFNAQSTDGVQP